MTADTCQRTHIVTTKQNNIPAESGAVLPICQRGKSGKAHRDVETFVQFKCYTMDKYTCIMSFSQI